MTIREEETARIFPFFHGEQAEQFSFYRVPKVLFTAPFFRDMSTDAKLLYGLLLDRMGLSMRNHWMDDAGRVYIVFTIDEIMEAMNCGDRKANRMLAELEKEYGLIERKRQGLGKPNLIYVRNFISTGQNCPVQNRENDDSGAAKRTILESSKQRCNKTENNKTDFSETESIYPPDTTDLSGAEMDGMDGRAEMCAYFSEQLDLAGLMRDSPGDYDIAHEILELLVDTCCSRAGTIYVAGDHKPKAVVQSQFMKLNGEHLRYVLSCLRENTTRIRNMKQYLLTALYNAPFTMDSYYQALVNHDMAWKPEEE